MALCYLSTRLSMAEAYSFTCLCRQVTKHQGRSRPYLCCRGQEAQGGRDLQVLCIGRQKRSGTQPRLAKGGQCGPQLPPCPSVPVFGARDSGGGRRWVDSRLSARASGTVHQQLNPLKARGHPPFWPRRVGGSRVPRQGGVSPLEAFCSEERRAVGRSSQAAGMAADQHRWGAVRIGQLQKKAWTDFSCSVEILQWCCLVPLAVYPRFLLIPSSLWESLHEQNTYWGNELALHGSALGLFQAVKHGHVGLFFKFLVPLRCNEPCLRVLYADHLNLL